MKEIISLLEASHQLREQVLEIIVTELVTILNVKIRLIINFRIRSLR